MKLKEDTLKSKLIYDGKILKLFVDDILIDEKLKSTREYCEHVFAVAILLKVGDKFILEKQFRYPVKKVTLEVPAGKGEINEDPLECAKREVKEETGYKIDTIKSLGFFYPAAAYCTEKIYLYYAEASELGETHFDEDERILLESYTLNELLDLISNNKIDDAKTIIIILKYLNMYVKNK